MEEIKSTLDLVMEKTKHLSFTEKEKEEQQYNEVNKKLKGLLQKYEDGILKQDQIRAELNVLQKACAIKIEKILKAEIIDRLNRDHTNNPLLILIRELCNINTTGVETALNDYQGAVVAAALKRIETIKTTLAEKHFVSGSAVVPNLQADNQWITELQEIQSKYDQILSAAKDKLKAA